MDGNDVFVASEVEKFGRCSNKLLRMVFRDTEEYKADINLVLDELNSVDYSLKLGKEEIVGQLICQCCYLVPHKLELLLTKVCHLIVNLVSKQQIVLSHGLETVTDYLLHALQVCPQWAMLDVLRALSAVVYQNEGKLNKFLETLIGPRGILFKLMSSEDDDIKRGAIQCVEGLCIKTPNQPYLSDEYQTACFQALLYVLQTQKKSEVDDISHSKLLINTLRGLQNILVTSKSAHSENLGPLLAALKVYMLYGLPGMPSVVATVLNPTPLSQYDPSGAAKLQENKQTTQNQSATKPTPSRKNKKKKPSKGKSKDKEAENVQQDSLSGRLDGMTLSDGAAGLESTNQDPLSFMFGSKLSSSESDYSDTEGAQVYRLRATFSRVRQCAMGCFQSVIKATDRRVMFGYWPYFIPTTPGIGVPSQSPTLFTVIMKDPAPKIRTVAVAILTSLLEGSKQYLMVAEDSEQYRTAPFTPFSVTLGQMIKEIHRCLMLALVAEQSLLAITQIIKCLATVISNVPYQRLKPGLLSRIVKQIRQFFFHRDPNIRVACLTCLGAMVSVQAPLLEVLHILQSGRLPQRMSQSVAEESVQVADSESGYQTAAAASSSDSSLTSVDTAGSSGFSTPRLLSGSETPNFNDQSVAGSEGEMSWVVRMCVRNVTPHLLDTVADRRSRMTEMKTDSNQPLPVRLESLQLLTQLTKGYFAFVRSCLFLVRNLIHCCLEDTEPAVQLHGAKLLEEAGSMMLQPPQHSSIAAPAVDITESLEFWLPMLEGPLLVALQTVSYQAVRSTGCDCLSNIGPQVFDKLAMDRKILCMTLLLGMTSDDDHHVRAASVRALGVYVLYPCLREDVSFVADAANAVILALEEENLNVRMKAAWSLGNISDALVLNKNGDDEPFIEDFSDMLLLKLFETAVKGSLDNDKVKSNAVRALGNFLRYLPQRSQKSSRFSQTLERAVHALVKNVSSGTMKVRWNACYACGNMFRNRLLPVGEWSRDIYSALTTVVKECKNFKVRINAAMALSIPATRDKYGTTIQYSNVWASLVTALQTAESICDFAEYRYRDSLTNQICATLSHLACLITVDDLVTVGDGFRHHAHIVRPYLAKYKQPTVIKVNDNTSVKDSPVVDVGSSLKQLESSVTLNTEQKESLDIISSVFTKEEEEPASASAFKQTYD